MVPPQAMAWVQYWFHVLSLKFCGKSKKNCGDIPQVSPAFCMYGHCSYKFLDHYLGLSGFWRCLRGAGVWWRKTSLCRLVLADGCAWGSPWPETTSSSSSPPCSSTSGWWRCPRGCFALINLQGLRTRVATKSQIPRIILTDWRSFLIRIMWTLN